MDSRDAPGMQVHEDEREILDGECPHSDDEDGVGSDAELANLKL